MLMRISLVVAILAGLAVGALNFVKVKEKIETIEKQREEEKSAKEVAQKDLRLTKADLKKTNDKLKQTETTLAATTEEKETALKNLDAATKLGAKLKDDLDKRTQDLENAKALVEKFRQTDLSPEEILAMKKNFNGLQNQLAEAKAVIAGLEKQVRNLKNELALYKDPEHVVPLPAKLRGRVVAVDPKWNFVVLDIGEDQGVLEQGELLVNRNARLVAKVKIRSVEKNRCIANIMPGWQLGEVLEGDQVIPAYPSAS